MRLGVLALLVFTTSLAAQQPARDALPAQTGTGVISGTVVTDEATSRPLRRAIVTVRGTGIDPGRVAVTDEQGRFTVASLPAGSFTVTAVKPAYVTMAYGQKRARGAGAPIALGAGQRVADVVIKLPRGAVLAGTITDEVGQPRPGVAISLSQYVTTNGERRLETIPPGMLSSVFGNATDSSGAFRIYGLPSGEYVLSVGASPFGGSQLNDLRRVTPAELQWADQQLRGATSSAAPGASTSTSNPPPPLGPATGIATVYYPGTPDARAAEAIKLEAGMERTDLNFPVALVPTARVEGTIVGPDGQPAPIAAMTMSRASGGGSATDSVTRPVQRGQFAFTNVTPGQYTLLARTPTANGIPMSMEGESINVQGVPAGPFPGYWGTADVSVNGQDIRGVTVTLQPGLRISGRVAFDGAIAPPADLTRIRVVLGPPQQGASAAPTPAQARPDGTFELSGVIPGRYRLSAGIAVTVGAPPATGWSLKSVRVGNTDVSDVVLEIKPGDAVPDAVVTFTDQSAELSGTLLDAQGRPSPDYFVVLFSTDKSTWTLGSRRVKPPVRPATDGTFRIAGLPGGEYFVAALTDVDPRDMSDSGFLEQISASAIKITLSDGEKKVQDVTLAAR